MANDIDYTKGFDEEMITDTAPAPLPENVVELKPKRAPYATWTVGGTEYKLRLTAVDISKLEQKYRRNLLLALTDDGIPPVADMLTVIQASMRTYHHGMTFLTVQSLYDQYVDEGGDQNNLMVDVILPLLSVSGFFTQSQAEMLAQEMKDIDSNI